MSVKYQHAAQPAARAMYKRMLTHQGAFQSRMLRWNQLRFSMYESCATTAYTPEREMSSWVSLDADVPLA